ncbi:MAG: hypothetical protein ACOYOV_00125 [Bacteroidales bacterium]
MLVVISGKARAGKDSVFNILAKCGGFKRIAFADPLKNMCSTVFNIPIEFFYDDDKKDTPFDIPVSYIDFHSALQFAVGADLPLQDIEFVSPRDLLQKVGTDIVRKHVADDFWIKLLVKELQNTDGNIAITDARFQNERDALKAIGGILMLVKKPNTGGGDSHITENDIGDESAYALVINNNGTLAQLDHDIKMWYSLKYAR